VGSTHSKCSHLVQVTICDINELSSAIPEIRNICFLTNILSKCFAMIDWSTNQCDRLENLILNYHFSGVNLRLNVSENLNGYCIRRID
jgi:hypothetical protein